MSLKRGAWWLILAFSLIRCVPDFDSLSSGAGDAGGAAGQASGGTATSTGGSDAGSAGDGGGAAGRASGGTATSTGGSDAGSDAGSAGDRGGATNQGGQTGNVAGAAEPEGGAPSAGTTGEGAVAGEGGVASGGESATGGEAAATGGQGGAPSQPCEFIHPGATRYNGFDGGLDGSGFTSATTTTALVTTLGTTATSEWDDTAGKSCPGALHIAVQFKGYAAGTASDERAFGNLHFSPADWTGAVELHAWVKVEPAAAPLGSVRLFLLSGESFLYDSAYDDTQFRSGEWNEMVLPLVPGANFDPARVIRIGVETMLQRQGEGSNPSLSAPIHVFIDDVWVK